MYVDDTFIYIGGSPDALDVEIPFPTVGDLTFQVTENVKSEINANGVAVSQRIGEPFISQHIGWGMIEAEKWWEVNRFFEKNGGVFYCKFFHQNLGEWQTKRFRRGDVTCDLMIVGEDGTPEAYEDAGFDIVSVGE